MKSRFLLYILLLIIHTKVPAQYYETGTDPAGISWLQIKTKNFRVIYPSSYGSEGIRFARSLDSSMSMLSAYYPVSKVRIPVVIHSHSTFSNGYVAWAPRRMEIYPTPEQNAIPLDPVYQLTIHELTHVLQMYSLKKGFSEIMPVFLGEQYTGALSILLPMWFLEGDAVLAESAFTLSGRGRSPAFRKEVKALITENKAYSYDKMIHGSFRDYVPDHYRFGYEMISWSSSLNGHRLWSDAIDLTARYPFTINPVNISLKKSDLTKAEIYRSSTGFILNGEKENKEKGKTGNVKIVSPPKVKEYINYHSPVMTGSGQIAAIKTSMSSPPRLVLISDSAGNEKTIHVPGTMTHWYLSGTGTKLVWVEQRPDPRWENRDYSVIIIHDLLSGRTKQLTHNSRYLAAAVSPDGRHIAASENTSGNINRLVLLDAETGDVVREIPSPGNLYLQRPQWSGSGKEITVITLGPKGEGISVYSDKTRNWDVLIPPGNEDLQSSFLRNDSLFYTGSGSGTDNLFVRLPSGEILILTNSAFGISDPSFSGNIICFSDYTSSGNNISTVELNKCQPVQFGRSGSVYGLPGLLDTLRNRKIIIPPQKYIPVPYRKMMHLFRFHSWMPFYADIDEIKADPAAVSLGMTLMSQNILSTLTSTAGYEYSGGRHMIHSKITWKGWVPVIESSLDKLGTSVLNELRSVFSNSVSLPLYFSSGSFSQYVRVNITGNYYDRHMVIEDEGIDDVGQFQLTGRILLYNYRKSSARDIYPSWAQVLDLSYNWFPFDRDIYGSLRTIKTAFYLPGFIRNHSIRLRFENDYQKPQNYSVVMHNRASFPRGYFDLVSLEYSFLSADYLMPLLYPDLNIPGLLYLKRIRGGVFFDYAKGSQNIHFLPTGTQFRHYTEEFRSFGTELLADFHILRVPFMISAGIQSAWIDLSKRPELGLLFKIDVFGMIIGNRSQQNQVRALMR